MDAADVCFAGAAEQTRLLGAGTVAAHELVQATLDRIDRLNPALNAYRVVFAERALTEADQADARRAAGDRRPLLGVPVAVKDDVDVAGETTCRGTLANRRVANADSEVIARLRSAGAIIVGKTHVPELAIWPFTESPSFGATRNPWSPERTPGGSSGGTAAAIAAGLAGVGLGSDGAGSIRLPAAFCGLFGLKPQRDRIGLGADRRDAWQGLVVYGPLARRVADATLFLDAVADRPIGRPREPGRLRIAVATRVPPGVLVRLGAEQRSAVEATAALLRSLGHDVTEREIDYGPRAALHVTARYLAGVRDAVASTPDPEHLEQRSRTLARLGQLFTPPVLRRVRAAERAIAARINASFDHADVLLTPGPSGAPFPVGAFDGHGALRSLNAASAKVAWYPIFNATGQPAASVPAGFDAAGLPLAVQLVARPGDEATLLALASQIEAERPWADRRPPL